MASRDAIKSGRLWIECNSALAPHIAGHVMRRVSFLQTCTHRIHVLYLVHDLLQTEAARKDAHAPLVRAFKPYLPWILRPCYQLATLSQGDETSRVLRLVQLWVDRSIISGQEAEEVKVLTMAKELPGAQASQVSGMPRPSMAPAPPGVRPPSLGFSAAPPQAPVGAPVGMPVPVLHGYQKQVLAGIQSTGIQTPETVPVGVLASLLANVANQMYAGRVVRYKPLDPAITPQVLPAMEVPTPQLLAKVEEFYEDLHEEDRPSSSSSSSRSRSRERGRDDARGMGALSAVPPPVC